MTEPQDSAKILLSIEQVLEKDTENKIDVERLKFGHEVLTLLDNMPTRIEKDSVWHLLPMKWYSNWEQHCYTDLLLAQDPSSANEARESPGKINFMDIFKEIDDD
jgi:hypothetical protein